MADWLRYFIIGHVKKNPKSKRKFDLYYCGTYEEKTDRPMILKFLESSVDSETKLCKDNRNFYKYEVIRKKILVVTGGVEDRKTRSKRRALEFHEIMKEFYFSKKIPPTVKEITERVKLLMEDEDEITKAFQKMETIKDLLIENIDKLFERGEKLEELYESSEEQEIIANRFKKKAKKLKWKVVRKCAVVGGVIGAIGGGAVGLVAGGVAAPVTAATGASLATSAVTGVGVAAVSLFSGVFGGFGMGISAPTLVGMYRVVTKEEFFKGLCEAPEEEEEIEEEIHEF